MAPLAYFGINSSGFNLAIDLLILFVVVLYFSLIYWTYADARRRIVDPMLVGCATAAAFFPFVGTIVYLVLRPPEYLEDVRERELEIQASEARLAEIDARRCPHCDYRIEPDFVRCPSCLRKLKERCANCSRPLDQAWTICPYCEADVPGLSAPRSRRRRSMAAIEAEQTLEPTPADAAPEEPVLASEPAPPRARPRPRRTS
jgi:Double zinc ribbon